MKYPTNAAINRAIASSMMTRKELAAIIGCTPRNVSTLEKRGCIPASCWIGHFKRWNRSTIEKWLADGCPKRPVKPNPTP